VLTMLGRATVDWVTQLQATFRQVEIRLQHTSGRRSSSHDVIHEGGAINIAHLMTDSEIQNIGYES